jgi:hypothetical protein
MKRNNYCQHGFCDRRDDPAKAGLAVQFGALCFYSSSVVADSEVLRSRSLGTARTQSPKTLSATLNKDTATYGL